MMPLFFQADAVALGEVLDLNDGGQGGRGYEVESRK